MPKRVCIIGAGSSGLTSIKACKEEGLEPVCYECTNHIGGLWRYRDEDVYGLGSVMKSTIINSSKEMSAFSDFPPPRDFPNYMHNSKMIRYIELYAKHFDLARYVLFQHKVLNVEQAEDFDITGRWVVTVKNTEKDKQFKEIFDGVMICSGHHVYPIIPKFLGQEEFKGTIIHTHSYKKPAGFEDKRVVVVGVGNSGGDVAVELSNIASQVYLSTRRGCWVIHRVGPKGRPLDITYMRRSWNVLFNLLPYPVVCYFVEREMNQRFDHGMYQLKPDHHIFGQHPMVNDALPNRILSGTVVVKGNIKQFTSKGILFEGEEEETEVDTVVLATGYEVYFPYLSKELVSVDNNKVELYKYEFPPNLKHRTLALIGLGQPVGALFPISELQARIFALSMSGKVKLPSTEEMIADIKRKEREMRRRYFSGPRHTIQMDWVNFMDELAELAGVKPDMLSTFINDPPLFAKCFFGPCLPYQYRLEGPDSWSGAREAIMSYDDRIVGALDTRHCSKQQMKNASFVKFLMACLSITMLALFLAIVV